MSLAVAAPCIGLLFYGAPASRSIAAAATPPPTPPPITAPVTPQPNASLGPAAAMTPSATTTIVPKGYASPSPPPNARKGIEGVWEIQIQRSNRTDYTHMVLKQDGATLTGTYVDSGGKKYPLAGSVDGQAVRVIVSLPNGTTLLLEGRLDGTTDMIGEFTSPQEQTAFTAAYRAKEKWIENVNASPGGLGGSGGGYTPP